MDLINKCKGLFEEKWGDFADKISMDIELHRRLVTKSYYEQYTELSKRIKGLDSIEDENFRDACNKRLYLFHFDSPYKRNSPIFYNSKDSTLNEMRDALVKRTNRNCQWLLVEAYEAFEDYIEWIYACTGFICPSIWPASDFGNISISEIDKLDLNDFYEKSKNKKNGVREMISQFRKVIPEFKEIERKNDTFGDLFLWVSTVEMFRHISTHNAGTVYDTKNFIFNTMDKAGLGVDRTQKPWIALFDADGHMNRNEIQKMDDEFEFLRNAQKLEIRLEHVAQERMLDEDIEKMRKEIDKCKERSKIAQEDRKLAFLSVVYFLCEKQKGQSFIYLLNTPTEGIEALGGTTDRFHMLISSLLSYAYLIKSELLKYIEGKIKN